MISAKIYPEATETHEAKLTSGKMISRKSSSQEINRMEGGGVTQKSSKSNMSLSADLVEAAMHDGQYRFLNEKSHEVAIWFGLLSFVLMSVGLIVVGLRMALSN